MSQSSYGRSVGLLSLLTVVMGGGLLLGGSASAQTMDMTSSTALVQAVMPLTIQTSYLPSFALGVPYMGGFSATGGTGVYRWSLIGGSLPSGMSLDMNGRLSGQPESMGTSMFTVRVMDNGNNVVQQTYQVVVGLAGADTNVSSTVPVADPSNTVIVAPTQVTPEPTATGTTTLPPITSPLIIPNWNTPRVLLLQNLEDLEIPEGSLIRVARDASGVNAGPHADVYYVGRDGKRHAFASEKVFQSWYEVEPQISTVPAWKLANIPLGKNVTYKPGKKLVTVESDSHVYAVTQNQTLRPLASQSIAERLYGEKWTQYTDQLSEALLSDYHLNVQGEITASSDFSPSLLMNRYQNPWQDMGME